MSITARPARQGWRGGACGMEAGASAQCAAHTEAVPLAKINYLQPAHGTCLVLCSWDVLPNLPHCMEPPSPPFVSSTALITSAAQHTCATFPCTSLHAGAQLCHEPYHLMPPRATLWSPGTDATLYTNLLRPEP